MKKDKLELYIVYGILTGTVAFVAMLCIMLGSDDATKYRVLDKENNKIVFEDIDAVRTRRVMDFDLDTDSTLQKYYKYINIGDTLNGKGLNKGLVVQPFGYTGRPIHKVIRITKINGHDVYKMIQFRADSARRDSIINSMKIKQK